MTMTNAAPFQPLAIEHLISQLRTIHEDDRADDVQAALTGARWRLWLGDSTGAQACIERGKRLTAEAEAAIAMATP
jgi:hypothetical protein